MRLHLIKVPLKVFSILFKVHWACCELILCFSVPRWCPIYRPSAGSTCRQNKVLDTVRYLLAILCTKKTSISSAHRIHLKLKPSFKCNDCELCFESKSQLLDHVTKTNHVTKEKIYDCDTCSKSFKKRIQLKKHVDTAHLKLKKPHKV